MTGFSGDSLNDVVSLWSFVAKRLKPVRYYNKLVSESHTLILNAVVFWWLFFFFFERSELKNEFEFGFTWMLGLNFRVKKKKRFGFPTRFYFLFFGFRTCPSKKLKQSPSFDSFLWLFISFSSLLFSFDTVSSSSTRCCAFIVLNDQRVETELESELIKVNRVRIWRMYYVFGCWENKGKWHRIMYYLQLLTLFFFFLTFSLGGKNSILFLATYFFLYLLIYLYVHRFDFIIFDLFIFFSQNSQKNNCTNSILIFPISIYLFTCSLSLYIICLCGVNFFIFIFYIFWRIGNVGFVL